MGAASEVLGTIMMVLAGCWEDLGERRLGLGDGLDTVGWMVS